MDVMGETKGKKERSRGKMRWGIMAKLKKELWRWKFFGSAFKWNRLDLQLSIVDDVIFKIVSLLEAIVLVLALCFLFFFCGCHF